jgi:preprotein translocase subunit SecA
MSVNILKKVFGSKNDRELRRLRGVMNQISALSESVAAMSDAELAAQTGVLKGRLAEGETLDQILPDAFAVVREASVRTLGLRHFDVQLMGGIALHEGRIAEMRTGEGKTLTATLPIYLNALAGKGVHVVTVNDYLAERDANWMRPIYEFLGLSVGIILSQQPAEEKVIAYQADVTYGTNNEYGFDYLRDNMAFRLEDKVQRSLSYAIVDEVDSILIDEARTPLIISGPTSDSSELYTRVDKLMMHLKKGEVIKEGLEEKATGDYTVDEKQRQVELTEQGTAKIEKLLIEHGLLEDVSGLYSVANLGLMHHVHAALKAHALFHRDRDYIVQEGEIVIVDEHTGRTMPGRRWSEGIHQAIEAKEGIQIQQESQTLASTTFQNYFRLYDKLAGMTGTADTEAPEFRQIYGMDVVVIPTNRPPARVDANDQVFMTLPEKLDAVVHEIKAAADKGAPVLVGTATIESSERVSERLRKAGVKHSVLNAKQHEREAAIIAQAGVPGNVTIATNMAGRGTDIVLGGNPDEIIKTLDNPTEEQVAEIRNNWQTKHEQAIAAGGLHIIGTERHESRRIDNQLRGRAGRQGDPGHTRFFLSMEDDLMRIFASDRVRNMMRSLGMPEGEAIEHRWVSRAIENAQKKVEGRNFDMRKEILDYDNVANDQRRVIYQQRDEILERDDLSNSVERIRDDVVVNLVHGFMPPDSIEDQWDLEGLEQTLAQEFRLPLPVRDWLKADREMHTDGVIERVQQEMAEDYRKKVEAAGVDTMRRIEKHIMLQVLDHHWKEHLASMDYLRQGIHLRGYAQVDPKQEYKREAFALFQQLLEQVQYELIRVLQNVTIQSDEEVARMEREREEEARRIASHMRLHQADLPGGNIGLGSEGDTAAGTLEAQQPVVREGRKIGRNEPCPCGSGKKYKQCHGRLSA